MRPFIVLTIFLLVPVHATFAEISWYLGAGGSLTGLTTKNFSADSGLIVNLNPNQTAVLSSGNLKDRTFGWQLFGTLMFSKRFGISVKYYDSGEAKDQWSGRLSTTTTVDPGPPLITTTTEEDFSFDGVMSVDGFTIYFVQTVPVTEKIEYTLQIGYSIQDMDFTWSTTDLPGSITDPGLITDDDTGFAIGGICRYKFLKHFAVSGEIEYSTVNFSRLIDNPFKFSINGEYHF